MGVKHVVFAVDQPRSVWEDMRARIENKGLTKLFCGQAAATPLFSMPISKHTPTIRRAYSRPLFCNRPLRLRPPGSFQDGGYRPTKVPPLALASLRSCLPLFCMLSIHSPLCVFALLLLDSFFQAVEREVFHWQKMSDEIDIENDNACELIKLRVRLSPGCWH